MGRASEGATSGERSEPAYKALTALLDWDQLRVFLLEASPRQPADAPDRWEQISRYVGERCPQSEPRPPATFEQVFHEIAELVPAGASWHADSSLGREVWVRVLYEAMRSAYDSPPPFLNLGYEGPLPPEATSKLRDEDEPYRRSIQLYQRLIGAESLEGKRVLEVGCGWGGGCSFVARYLEPALVAGLDLVESNLECCRAHGLNDRLRFFAANAVALPFRDASFDVVLNLESSGAYVSFSDFAMEVHRVLAPGGRFLFGDIRPNASWNAIRIELVEAGFAIEDESDITDGVLQSIESQEAARELFLKESESAGSDQMLVREIMIHFALKHSADIKARARRFMRFLLRARPAG